MTAKQIIIKVMHLKPGTHGVDEMVHWINLLERRLALRVLAFPRSLAYAIAGGENEISLPPDCAKVSRACPAHNRSIPGAWIYFKGRKAVFGASA